MNKPATGHPQSLQLDRCRLADMLRILLSSPGWLERRLVMNTRKTPPPAWTSSRTAAENRRSI